VDTACSSDPHHSFYDAGASAAATATRRASRGLTVTP
jgi:hypothetical protein